MNQEEAMRKAIACLKLAKSSNANEAALAAAKAQEIIDRYGLQVTDDDFDNQEDRKDQEPIMDFGDDPLDQCGKHDAFWCVRLISVVCHFNGCRWYYVGGGDLGKVLKVIGRPSDVATVRYLYGLLKGEVKRLQSENCVGRSGAYRYQYGLGVADTIYRRMHEQRQATVAAVKTENASNPFALVRVNTALAKQEWRMQAVDRVVKEKKMKSGRGSGNTQSYTGFVARSRGRIDGEGVRMGGSAKAGLGSGRGQIGGGL